MYFSESLMVVFLLIARCGSFSGLFCKDRTVFGFPSKLFVLLQRYVSYSMMMSNHEYIAAEAVGLLRSLIRIPSPSREEAAAAGFLQQYIEAQGMETGRKGNNVWCFSPMFTVRKPTLLLNSHIDTVKPAGSWQKDPFTPTEVNGKLYGLGSNDAGASVVSLLHAFMQLCRTEQSYNLIFLASCEEEVSGENGIESVLPELPPISFAIVGEPTEMQLAIAEKGLMVLDVTVWGKAGHAARNEGENAIYKSLQDIEWFRDYRFERESPLLGPVKMSVTQINAGAQHNVTPDRCTFVVDVRSNELYGNEELFEIIGRHVSGEVKARSFRLNSSRLPEEHPFVQKAIRLGRETFGSPTLSDQARMPFPSVKMGPGHSSRSHTADEYIRVKEIEEAIGLYIQLLNGLSL
jgi:acetylornithine deacetylase